MAPNELQNSCKVECKRNVLRESSDSVVDCTFFSSAFIFLRSSFSHETAAAVMFYI